MSTQRWLTVHAYWLHRAREHIVQALVDNPQVQGPEYVMVNNQLCTLRTYLVFFSAFPVQTDVNFYPSFFECTNSFVSSCLSVELELL